MPKDYVIRESIDVLLQALELIDQRFRAIITGDGFLKTEDQQTLVDAIYLRLQIVSQKIDRIESVYPDFFSERSIDVNDLRKIDKHIELNYEELDRELIFDICINIIPAFHKKLILINL